MIQAAHDHLELEILGERPDSAIFPVEIEEAGKTEPGVLALHLIQMADGQIWTLATEQAEEGFATICGSLQGDEVFCATTDARELAMRKHFEMMAVLISSDPHNGPQF